MKTLLAAALVTAAVVATPAKAGATTDNETIIGAVAYFVAYETDCDGRLPLKTRLLVDKVSRLVPDALRKQTTKVRQEMQNGSKAGLCNIIRKTVSELNSSLD